jgi:urease accessory protein
MKRIALPAILSMAAATPALAHTGTGIGMGFAHPFLGLDHVLAMLAVGAWAMMLGGRAIWCIPTAFLAAMSAGGLLALLGVSLPFAEATIALSAAVLAGFVLGRVRMPVAAGMSVVALFAIAHGYAHGAEMPATAEMWAYGLGFTAATALLHALGALAAGAVLRRRQLAA